MHEIKFDEEAFKKQLAEHIAQQPRIPGVDWSMALPVAMLRVLDERLPGFRNEVRDSIRKSATSMENSGDDEMVADAPSMHELAASWIFTE